MLDSDNEAQQQQRRKTELNLSFNFKIKKFPSSAHSLSIKNNQKNWYLQQAYDQQRSSKPLLMTALKKWEGIISKKPLKSTKWTYLT